MIGDFRGPVRDDAADGSGTGSGERSGRTGGREVGATVLLSLFFILAGTSLAIGAMLVVRRVAPPKGFLSGMESADGIFSAAGAGLAVLLAFVIFTVFESYENGREATGEEAVAAQQMYQTAGFFPDKTDQLRGEVVCYSRSVIHIEWPEMQHGRESAVTQKWIDDLVTTSQQASITGNRQGAALEHWLTLGEERQDARRTRIAESQPFVPGFVWAILILMVLMVAGFQCLFADPTAPAFGQAVAMGAMSATLFSALTLIWVLDRPFNNRGAEVTPSRMQASLVIMSHDARLPATLPCDANGNPT